MRIKKTFTLVELIVVIAILAILSVTAFLTLTKWFGKSRDSRRTADLATIATAINTAFAEPNRIVRLDPTTSAKYNVTGDFYNEAITKTLLIDTWKLDSITKVPTDPVGNNVYYAIGVYYNASNGNYGKYFQLAATLENDIETGDPVQNAYLYGNYTVGIISGVNYPSLIMSGSYNVANVDTGTFVTGGEVTELPYRY